MTAGSYSSPPRRLVALVSKSDTAETPVILALSAAAGISWRSAIGELLIDLEEDKAARAVVFGLLAEMERK
jgi:hypothetical protein